MQKKVIVFYQCFFKWTGCYTVLNMKIESTYKLRNVHNGKPFFGAIVLTIEVLEEATQHQLIEAYKGEGFLGQGHIETIPAKGYKSWKIGIRRGINYALGKLLDKRSFKVTVVYCRGMTTDTNPVILAFVASRAVLDKLEHEESQQELAALEQVVFSSWEHSLDSQLNFEKKVIEKLA